MALIVLFVLIFPLFFDLESLSTVSTDLSNFFSDFSILNHTAFWSRSCPALLTRFGPVNQALQADGKADFASTHRCYALAEHWLPPVRSPTLAGFPLC